jgi:pseudoazurin
MILRLSRLVAASLLACSLASAAHAEEHVVKMLNTDGKGKFMIYDPEIVRANVGDTVRFVPTTKGHNAETIPELWPEGADTIKGAINEEVVLTVTKPGIYGIKCMPHYPMGMIGFVVAGEPTNKEQVDTYKPMGGGQKRLDALKAELGQ